MSILALQYLFWACLAVFLIANRKSLFGAWHFRIFRILFHHFRLHRSRRVDVDKDGYQAIFQPIVTSSYSPLLECDYNLHKSNSTYFTDLDVNHTHLLSNLFKELLSPSPKEGTRGIEGKLLTVALGGVACTFTKDIKPYEKYEVWTRVLCWDEKWLYVVSHFVKHGAVRPAQDSFNRGGIGDVRADERKRRGGVPCDFSLGSEQDLKKIVFASSMAKYVFKRGRITVPPRSAMESIGLLPRPPSSLTPDGPHLHQAQASRAVTSQSNGASNMEKWTLTRLEEENEKGLKVAAHLAQLVRVQDSFTGPSASVQGIF
ncbi:hypothetical protein BP6252_13188 [Coleophoma cylindrospora]|uniref:Capsule polysaccharide biosynthesis protein n=1 Tax=Coleophoma cylindrospora TaxID=1849047 RepID=A0A3D8QA39_9HELO|nr:hypothetical protein BP6252_13188 [Coleophoma cylindrospora]